MPGRPSSRLLNSVSTQIELLSGLSAMYWPTSLRVLTSGPSPSLTARA